MEGPVPLSLGLSRPARDPKQVGLWKIGRTLGKGNFGRVKIAKHSRTGRHAAIKIISKRALNKDIPIHSLAEELEKSQLSIEREIVVMKLLDHPNIMHIYDVWETSSNLYLVMEYVKGGDLYDLISKKGRFSTLEARHLFRQIISAVDYFHRFNIAHRDLKLENILVDENNNVKVADFGMAIWQGDREDDLLQTCCGSLHYAAPEVIQNQGYKGTSADIWSCGVILYILLVAKLPFEHEAEDELYKLIKKGRYTIPSSIDSDAKKLVKQLLNPNPITRITTTKILEQPFLHPNKPPVWNHPLPKPPSIVDKCDDVDPCLLANLKALWHEMPVDDILTNLRSKEPNWQKTIYWLLVSYREKHLEEINADAEDEQRLARERTRRRAIKSTHKKAFSTGHVQDILAEGIPPRDGPPTPRRAARHQRSLSESSAEDAEMMAIAQAPSSPNGTATPSQRVPRLTPPKVKNQEVQEFFNQVADQMNELDAKLGGTSEDVWGPNSVTPIKALRILPSNNAEASSQNQSKVRPLSINWKERQSSVIPDKTTDKENLGIGRPPSRFGAGPGANKRASKGVDVDSATTKISKKQATRRSSDAGTSSGSPSSAPPAKRRWLENVFSFRPAPLTLLSTCDFQVTRNECRKLLMEMSVDVAPENELSGSLKCKMNEFKDPAGVMTSLKPVRFKVVFQQPRIITYGDDQRFVMALTLVHERGAPETFKEVCKKLEQVWMFDPLHEDIE